MTCWARMSSGATGGSDRVEAALADGCEQRRALDELVAGGREKDPLGYPVAGVVGTPDPLQEGRDRPRRTHLAGQLDRADVDAELEGGGRHECPKVPGTQARLGAPPPLRRQAPVVGRHLVRSQDLAEQVGQALGQPAGVHENERRLVALDVGGDALDDVAHLFLRKDGRQLLLG